MASEDGETLETLLNKATSPFNRDEDWEFIMGFCDQVNKELEGPQIAVRLLAHKIQSPQEKEALFALSTLEACVKNCGKRFHQEIGKFRFLNELIKVVSPKYLGNLTSERVKNKCIELMYSWSTGLKHESKVQEAYEMLKKQGIVKQDPVHVDQTFEPPLPDREKSSIFDDDDKSKLLSRLLRSKHPEDLQAANRLIKNMVKQDAERIEKQSRRVLQLETINNNLKLLGEMLAHYRPGNATEADLDIMKQLYDTLERERPNLFRLASDTDEKDNDGMKEILACNDDIAKIMLEYKKLLLPSSGEPSLLSDAGGLPEGPKKTDSSDLDQLSDIFGPAPGGPGPISNASNMSGLLDLDSGLVDHQSILGGQPAMQPPLLLPHGLQNQQPTTSAFTAVFPSQMSSEPVTGILPSLGSASVLPASTMSHSMMPPASQPPPTNQASQKTLLDDLDLLGQSMMQQSLTDKSKPQWGSSTPSPHVSLNTIAAKQAANMAPAPTENAAAATTFSLAPSVVATSQPAMKTLAGVNSPSITPPGSNTASPRRTLASPKMVDVKPLTDMFVPLESVKPGTVQPLTAHDKNQIKIVIHFGKDSPRPDVLVMVVSVMSTSDKPVKNFQFQAAVPKVMRVKLQPPSATDLPAFNPILPPAAITQVMLIANPLKEKIRLRYKVSCIQDNQSISDVGDVDNFPLE